MNSAAPLTRVRAARMAQAFGEIFFFKKSAASLPDPLIAERNNALVGLLALGQPHCRASQVRRSDPDRAPPARPIP
jgi:hypothetical protein